MIIFTLIPCGFTRKVLKDPWFSRTQERMIGEDDLEPLNVSSTCMRHTSPSPVREVIVATNTGIRFSDSNPGRNVIAIIRLEQLKHKKKEDYRVFGAKITRIVLKAYPVAEMTSMAVESLKVNHFQRGLNPDLAEMIRRRQPKFLDIAAEMAKIHEVNLPHLQGVLKRKSAEQ